MFCDKPCTNILFLKYNTTLILKKKKKIKSLWTVLLLDVYTNFWRLQGGDSLPGPGKICSRRQIDSSYNVSCQVIRKLKFSYKKTALNYIQSSYLYQNLSNKKI